LKIVFKLLARAGGRRRAFTQNNRFSAKIDFAGDSRDGLVRVVADLRYTQTVSASLLIGIANIRFVSER
jgi:hypothetical protein